MRTVARGDGPSPETFIRAAVFGVPLRFLGPVNGLLAGGPLQRLPTSDAVRLLEAVIYLQWAKAGVGALVALGELSLVDHFLRGQDRAALELGGVTVMLWTPAFMLLLIAGRQQLLARLRRTGNSTDATPPFVLRWGPVLALGVALLCASLTNR